MGSLSQASLCATRTTPPRPHHRRVTRNSPEMAGLNFFENFVISGIAAGVAKTATAPIERVKLLVQNQDEMLKQGRLDKPILLGEKPNPFLSFLLGWVVTTVAGLGGYPIDTVRRRMMMTSGGGVKYNGSIDCFSQVVKNEGVGSLFKGAGANVMRGMGGAAVLAFCDVFKDAYVSWKKSS